MLSRIIPLVSFVLLVCHPQTALALSFQEIKELTAASPAFAKAEKQLAATWNALPKESKTKLQKEQDDWNKTLRDKQAGIFTARGKSRAEAYALVSEWRADWLKYKTSGARLDSVNDKDIAVTYTGQLKDGKAEGRGTAVGRDYFEGEFKQGWNISGLYIWQNGTYYEGRYLEGKLHGRGVETFANGDRYEGEYKDGQRQGKGVYTFAGGERYEGEFDGNRRHGKGITIMPDGRRYAVAYNKGERVGGMTEIKESNGKGASGATASAQPPSVAAPSAAPASTLAAPQAAPPKPLPVPKVPPRPDATALLRRAEKGDAQAWVALSELHYMAGREYMALESADKAAKLDQPAGFARAAFMRYVRADTVARRDSAVGELQRAWKPLSTAAETGDAPAMNILGELYQGGLQTLADPPLLQGIFGGGSAPEPDMGEASRWFQKSADAGNALGKLLLGRLYFSGKGVKEDTTAALRLFAEADPIDGPVFGLTPLAKEGEMGAVKLLGAFYGYRGEMEKSLQWARKAAEAGDPEAICSLGQFYYNGAGGVKQDFAEANRLFQKAADGGYTAAWLRLAFSAAYGLGMEANFRQARGYLDSARNNGFDSEKAGVALAAIERREALVAEQAEAKRKQEEEERQRAEQQRRWAEERAHACDHVYVGKTFYAKYERGFGALFGIGENLRVLGFNPSTRQVTLRLQDGSTIERDCSFVPR